MGFLEAMAFWIAKQVAEVIVVFLIFVPLFIVILWPKK